VASTGASLARLVYVDLGEGRNVTALLASGPNATNVDYPAHVIPAHFNLSYDDKDLRKYSRLTGRWKLEAGLSGASGLPTFLTFINPNDPKSAYTLSPGEFGQAFGAKVHLKNVWIEMTTDPVTSGLRASCLGLPTPSGTTLSQRIHSRLLLASVATYLSVSKMRTLGIIALGLVLFIGFPCATMATDAPM
jgi:hypothetical protein